MHETTDEAVTIREVTGDDLRRLALGQHPKTGTPLIPEKIRSKDSFTAGQEEAAAAVFTFAKRWDEKLTKAAKQIPCNCRPIRDSSDGEFDHDPHCPVARVLQLARLLGEEGESVRAEVFGVNRLEVGAAESEQ